jgi:DNA-binding NarL/FixJ family response regulator
LTNLVVVDDHQMFRAGLVNLLGATKDFNVVGEAGSTPEALEKVLHLRPDFVTLDVELDDQPVATTIKRIRRASARTRVVVLTMHTDNILEQSTLAAGASAFVSKASPVRELIRTMRDILAGRTLAQREAQTLLLSERESEVLRHLQLARANKEIAARLGIAEGTVKRHTSNIYEKLGVSSRLEAVTVARRLGI